MAIDNIFSIVGDFLRENVFGGDTLGYTLFAIFLIAMLFFFLLYLDIPSGLSLIILSPAIVGIFTDYIDKVWIVALMLIAILITLGIAIYKRVSGG